MKKHYKFPILLSLAGAVWLFGISAGAIPQTVCVGGHTVGMKVQLAGLFVSQVEDHSAAYTAGLRNGDCILKVNGKAVQTPQELIDRVAENQELILTIERSGTTRELRITPTQSDSGTHLGISVQGELTGIGTITYYDLSNGQYGALGHGICSGKGELYEITGGSLIPSTVTGVVKSRSGTAGQLEGAFDTEATIGTITENTRQGVFGNTMPLSELCVPVASDSEIAVGDATLLTNVEGDEIGEYQIKILRKLTDFTDSGRDMLIQITDEKLLQKTGGIVQGMSGSPILQNGKIIGAVTHVLVNAPNYGYGITIEKMLGASERASLAA